MTRSSPDFATPANCACFSVRRAARALTQRYEAALKPVGLTSSQFTLLAKLKGLGHVTQSTLADAVGADRTTLTRGLQRLERDGLVAVEEGGDDRRERIVALTPAGARKFATALPLWRIAQANTVARLGEKDAAHLLALLTKAAAI